MKPDPRPISNRLSSPLFITLALVGAFLLAGCVDGSGDTRGDTVVIQDMVYKPDTLSVPVGTTVTWKNMDITEHTVTPTDPAQWGTDGSGNDQNDWLGRGDTWSHTFTEPGTYTYRCIPHSWEHEGEWKGQVGTIIVEEST